MLYPNLILHTFSKQHVEEHFMETRVRPGVGISSFLSHPFVKIPSFSQATAPRVAVEMKKHLSRLQDVFPELAMFTDFVSEESSKSSGESLKNEQQTHQKQGLQQGAAS